MDPRRTRSRAKIQAALRDMLAESGLSDIRIDELCRLAEVSRVTFYANFGSVQAVLDDYLDDVLTRLEHELNTVAPRPGPLVPDEEKHRRAQRLMTWIFEQIGAKDPRMRALLSSSQPRMVEERFLAHFKRFIIETEAREPAQPWPGPDDREIALHFFIGAFLSLLRLWIAHPEAYTARQLGERGALLITYGRTGMHL
ncbi:TetR/AcrR family transcriptional regulator [Pseudooceanicola sp. LIPI14-2-Ac024]|uniref:TetR/AcrR family transcriptional regulator n=1 Tax=Pseudooceanicola sp. LIPI14-2-Ac024 TaxID=3344875 RepID=UPI0035D02988